MEDDGTPTRRQLLQMAAAASATGLAGCLGGSSGGGHGGTEEKEFSDAFYGSFDTPVPEGQENCVSQDGYERSPDGLSAKDSVAYQFHPRYKEEPGYGTNPTQMCANCQFFCPAQPPNENTSDIVGACAVVEGGIRSEDWCALWQPAEHISRLND